MVAAPALLERTPLVEPADAEAHVLLDIDGDLPLARYALSVSPGLSFGDVWRLGTGAAVQHTALAGLGIAVLPVHMVESDLREGRLVRVLPELELLGDTFRLIIAGALRSPRRWWKLRRVRARRCVAWMVTQAAVKMAQRIEMADGAVAPSLRQNDDIHRRSLAPRFDSDDGRSHHRDRGRMLSARSDDDRTALTAARGDFAACADSGRRETVRPATTTARTPCIGPATMTARNA